MNENFRIKEVAIKNSYIDVVYFYPQQKSKTVNISGHLWWKKQVIEESWNNLYKDKKTGVFYTQYFDDTELLVETNFETARKMIDEVIEYVKNRQLKVSKNNGVNVPDISDNVKLHSIE